MKHISKLLVGVILAGSTQMVAMAADSQLGSLQISDAWIRASAAGQSSGAGYMVITNKSASPDRLLAASSPAAGRVEIHTTITEGGAAKMIEIKDVVIPANGSAKFTPTGNHVMFLQIKGPFKDGEVVPVMLKFENAGEANVDFAVKPTTYNPGGAPAMQMHDHAGMK